MTSCDPPQTYILFFLPMTLTFYTLIKIWMFLFQRSTQNYLKYKHGLICNKLSLNISKTNSMYFRNTNTPSVDCNIQINGVPLTEKLSTTFLGVTIDANLTWHEHVHRITNSISRNIVIIYKLKDLIYTKSLFLLYNAFILPFLNYCNIVWGNCNKTKINTLLLLQKRALRICSHSNYLAHTTPIFQTAENSE